MCKLWNATAVFIINLHITDVLFGILILPLSAMTFAQRHWIYGIVMCRVYALLKYGLNAVSIFTILAITINRYVLVCHPLLYPKIYKTRNLSIMLLAIWISAFALFLLPTFGLYGQFKLEPGGGFCTMLRDINNRSPKTFMLCFAFALPYIIIVLCYTRVWWIVRKTAKKSIVSMPTTHLPISDAQPNYSGNKKQYVSFEKSNLSSSTTEEATACIITPTEEREGTITKIFKAPFRATKKEVRSKLPTRRDKKLRTVIAAIMLSFCLTHMPIMITRIAYRNTKLDPTANVIAHMLEYFASFLNPMIYGFMSREYRKAYKNLFESTLNKILKR
ncbi:G-protein coupled receptor moody-like isoform X2 [Trichoplusia ni]|uniref:G-protein coupled receptor moody-like isoform X2 n=1 Tax=Trichoplusia ni TaxID=7111 RepID=A0A7E5VPL0_TRINI|nr:G-protein coupled receptor moody-like isoform X2 [Trichoplusia ni]